MRPLILPRTDLVPVPDETSAARVKREDIGAKIVSISLSKPLMAARSNGCCLFLALALFSSVVAESIAAPSAGDIEAAQTNSSAAEQIELPTSNDEKRKDSNGANEKKPKDSNSADSEKRKDSDAAASNGAASNGAASNGAESNGVRNEPGTKDAASTRRGTRKTSEPDPSKIESSDGDADDLKWPQAIESGSTTLFSFTEAISGKRLKRRSYDLLLGVTQVALRGKRLVFTRVDNQELEMGDDTAHGTETMTDWEKSKANAAKQFGPKGKEFLDSIQCIKVNGNRVDVLRTDSDLSVEMGERKLHRAFDLRGLRFRNISFLIDCSQEHPFLKDITGVTVLLNAPGFCIPVDVKEFHKWKTEKGTDLKVGVRNPVPNALRTVLFMPALIHFHFFMPKKN
jgi:hypothetical protein